MLKTRADLPGAAALKFTEAFFSSAVWGRACIEAAAKAAFSRQEDDKTIVEARKSAEECRDGGKKERVDEESNPFLSWN